MKCPVCENRELTLNAIEPGLVAASCGACHGNWIDGAKYLEWIDNAPPQAESVERAAIDTEASISSPATDSGPGRRCPQCGHFLHRAPVAAAIPFTIQRCSTCGGFWLDAGEWDTLKAQGFARRLHHIFSDVWQHRLERARQVERDEHLWSEKLGNDIAEARRVKAWLDNHPQRSEVLAYLLEHEPTGVAAAPKARVLSPLV